jgi:hypothetical protein
MITPETTPVYGRRAYGPQRRLTPEQKARFVAESILQHEIEGDTWELRQYGLDVESEQWQRVLAALGALRKAQEGAAA